jgi:hypothetical protein
VCCAWAWKTAFLTTTTAGWSDAWSYVGTFDFDAGCGIDAPRITSTTAVLNWTVVASFVALWAWWATWWADWADWAGDEGLCQIVQAFSAIWSSTNIAAFDFSASFWIDAETVTGRTVSLNNLEVTEDGALWNITANDMAADYWRTQKKRLFVFLLRAWAGETAFLTTTAVGLTGGWSDFGTFDFITGLWIDAPRVAGAAAELFGIEETLSIA